jgi:hypothetical protein
MYLLFNFVNTLLHLKVIFFYLNIVTKKPGSVAKVKNSILELDNKNSVSSDQHPQVKQQRSPEEPCIVQP